MRGTTTRHADLPSERGAGLASVIGLLAAVGVLAVAAFLVLRSSGATAPTATRTASPRASGALAGPSAPGSGLSSGLLSPGPSTGVATAIPASDTPSQALTPPPGTFPPTTDFTCETATIGDPTVGRWRVRHVTWRSARGIDTVVLDMTREGDSSRSGTIRVEPLSLDQVSTSYGMSPPRNADRAIVVTFERRVNAFKVSPLNTNMSTVPNFAMDQGSDALWHAVLGVVGNGCHRIGVPTWQSDPAATDAQLLIDVRKP